MLSFSSQAHLNPLPILGISKALFHDTCTSIKRPQIPNRKNWASNVDRHFPQRDTQMARKHEKMLNIRGYREI